MPLYEYRCEACQEQFELKQSIHDRAEDAACPKCKAKKATRLLSSFASKIVWTHKPTFTEDKAYSMLNQRMDKFSKLPPIAGKRTMPAPNVTGGPESASTGTEA